MTYLGLLPRIQSQPSFLQQKGNALLLVYRKSTHMQIAEKRSILKILSSILSDDDDGKRKSLNWTIFQFPFTRTIKWNRKHLQWHQLLPFHSKYGQKIYCSKVIFFSHHNFQHSLHIKWPKRFSVTLRTKLFSFACFWEKENCHTRKKLRNRKG